MLKTQNISDFFAKRGGGLANSKISLSEKTRPFQIAERGGGVSEFRSFSEKNQYFFFDASPYLQIVFNYIKMHPHLQIVIDTLPHQIYAFWYSWYCVIVPSQIQQFGCLQLFNSIF